MQYPVDILAAVSQAELQQSAQTYMTELLYSNPESPEQLTLPNSTQLVINISTVGLVPLYGSCDTHKVLALFAPADPFTPAALYLLDKWWTVSEILRTADSTRDGVIQVNTVGERIILYVLNRIVYRVQEMSSDELPFLCHGEKDYAKILWRNGEAVGFYSVKVTGSSCSSFSSRTYPLPVMDSMFVRKHYRGKGLGLRMLEDYVDSFKEDCLGLRYPLTTAMYKVCQCYLQAFPGDSELLWEVDSSRLDHRTTIASKIQSLSLRAVSQNVTYQSSMPGSVHHTEETVEEVTIVTKGCEEVPAGARSAGSRHGIAGQKHTEEQSHAAIRISEEVTLSRLEQNSEVVQTEELLNVSTKNGTGIPVTELEEEALFHKVTSLQRSEEDSVTLGCAAEENVPENLNTLCSSVMTVENVASEMEESAHTPEHDTVEELSHKTTPPQGLVTMERVLRTVVNIPLPSTVGEGEADVDKPVDESEITEEAKNKEVDTAENQAENAEEETPVVHEKTLRGSHSATTCPRPTRTSKRHKKAEVSAAEQDAHEHKSYLVQEKDKVDRVDEHAAADRVDTVEETPLEDSMTAEDAKEEQNKEAISIAASSLDTNILSDTENPEHTGKESSLDLGRKSQPETILRDKDKDRDVEQDLESLPKAPVPLVKIRALKSGPKILATTIRCRCAAGKQEPKQDTIDRPQDEHKDILDARSETTIKESSSTGDQEGPDSEELTSEKVDTEEMVETRVLRSGAITVSGVPTPRTTRSRKQKAEEDIVETTALKKGKKSTGRKRVSRPEEPAQWLKTSPAEGNATDGAQAQQQTPDHALTENAETPLPTPVDKDEVSKNEPVENSEVMVLTETKAKEAETAEDTAAEEDRKEQEPSLGEEDTLNGEDKQVEAKTEDTIEEAAVVDCTSAEAAEEEAADVALVPPSTAEVEDTEQAESTAVMESQPEIVMEENQAEPSRDKESEPESLQEKPEETTSSVETRSLRSGLKTLTATLGCRHTAERHAAQPETLDRPHEEPQNEQQDATEAQIEEIVAAETPTEAADNEHAQPEAKAPDEATEEVPEVAASQTKPPEEAPELAQFQTNAPEESTELAPSQTNAPEETPELALPQSKSPEQVVANEEELFVAVTPEVTNLSSKLDEAGEVLEPRSLRSGASTVSGVPTPRTTRSRKQKAEEDIVETPAVKRGRKSTGKKQVSRPEEPAQELKTSSAEEDATEGAQAQPQTPDHAPTENAEMPVPTAVDEDGVSKNKPETNSEVMVLTETKAKEAETAEDTAAEDDRKEQEPALGEEDALEAKTEDTMEKTAIAESTSADGAEEKKREEAADVALVPLSIAEVEDREQAESTLEMDKESQPETVMEENQAEPGRDKEPEPDSLTEKPLETTPSVETRSLRSGPKTLTATPRCRHTAGREAQQKTLNRPQEESQNAQQDAIETQIEESVAAETLTEALDNELDPSQLKPPEEASELVPFQITATDEAAKEAPESPPSQTKDYEESPEKAVTNEAVMFVAITPEVTNLSSEQDEPREVVEPRVLRSGARTVSGVPTPKTTRNRKQKAEEDIDETTAMKRGRESTGRKQVSRPEGTAQEMKTSSAEEDEIPLPAAMDEDGISKNEPVENLEAIGLAETKAKEAETAEDPAAEEDRKEPEPALGEEDALEVKPEDKMEETAGVESTSYAGAAEEKKKEEASDVALVPLSTTGTKDTQQAESTLEMDKESQPETVMEENQTEPGRGKEPKPESLQESPEETTPSVETRSLRSGPKTLTATPRGRDTAGRQVVQHETLDRPHEEPQNEQQGAIEAQIEESAAAEIPSEAADNEHAQPEAKAPDKVNDEVPELAPTQTKPPEEAPELAQSQNKSPEEAPEQVVANEEELFVAVTPEVINLSFKLDEAGEVLESRSLRSGARKVSGVPTPRTTRSRKQKAEEDIVETPAVKRGRKSTGMKKVSRPELPQELQTSSAEEDATEGAQVQPQTPDHAPPENVEMPVATAVDKDGVSKNEPETNSEVMVLTETKAKEAETAEDTAAEEDRKEPEPALGEEDALEVKPENKMEETAVVESTSTEAAEEEKKEEAADVALVPLSTAETEDTQQAESTLEMDKESQPETVMEENQAEPGRGKEPEPESLQERPEETTPSVETRSLRSGPKTLTATPRCRDTAGRQAAQHETLDRPHEEPQNAQQDAIEAQIEESAAAETPTEAADNEHAQPEAKAPDEANEEVPDLAPSQTKSPEEAPELAQSQTKAPDEALEEAVTKEEDFFVAGNPEVTNLLFKLDEAGEVVEPRVLRSGARTVSGVPTPRTTRSRKQKAEEDIIETTAMKRGRESTEKKRGRPEDRKLKVEENIVETSSVKKGRKSAGRKQVSRPEEPAQELKTSSAEEDATEGAQAQQQTPDHAPTENAEMPFPTAVDEDGVSKNEPTENSEVMVLTETKAKGAEAAEDTAVEEDRKEQEPALGEEDTLNGEDKHVEAKPEDKMKETAVVDSTSAEAAQKEKTEEAADVALVPLSTAEAEDTEQTESTLEMDRESQTKTLIEENQAEPSRDKEPETESLQEKPEEMTPSKETRSLRSGPKALTATLRRRHTAERKAAQHEKLDKPQEKTQNQQQDAIEAQTEESVAAGTPTEAVKNELDPSQIKAPEEAPEEAVSNEEELFVAITPEVTSLSSKLDEAGEVVEPRVLRSGARTVSGVPTPRTTRSRKQKAEEDTVETPAVKRGSRKSTAKKRISRPEEPAQELKTSSAEEDATEGAQAQQHTPDHTPTENAKMPLPPEVDEDGVRKNEQVENSEVMTETKETETAEDTAAEDDRKEQEPALVEEDTVEAKPEDKMKETAVVDSTSAEAAEKEKREEAADVALVPLSTAEAEDTEQAESTLERDSHPETVMEENQAEPGRDKEPQPESLPKETTLLVETRSLRSGPKTLTATPRCRHTAGRQAAQQETLDRPQEKHNAIEAQIEENVAAETPIEAVYNEHDQTEIKTTDEATQEAPELAPSKPKAPEDASEMAQSQTNAYEKLTPSQTKPPEEAVANEEDLFVAVTPEVTNLDEAGETRVETRVIGSGDRTVSEVPTPRTARSRKQKAEDKIFETTAVKRGRKSSGRKQVSRPEEPAQGLKTSSAQEDATEGSQAELPTNTAPYGEKTLDEDSLDKLKQAEVRHQTALDSSVTDLPMLTVVLVDFNKVQLVKSVTEHPRPQLPENPEEVQKQGDVLSLNEEPAPEVEIRHLRSRGKYVAATENMQQSPQKTEEECSRTVLEHKVDHTEDHAQEAAQSEGKFVGTSMSKTSAVAQSSEETKSEEENSRGEVQDTKEQNLSVQAKGAHTDKQEGHQGHPDTPMPMPMMLENADSTQDVADNTLLEEVPLVSTRVLRSGRKSASQSTNINRSSTKRADSDHQEDEDEHSSSEDIHTEETNNEGSQDVVPEKSPEKSTKIQQVEAEEPHTQTQLEETAKGEQSQEEFSPSHVEPAPRVETSPLRQCAQLQVEEECLNPEEETVGRTEDQCQKTKEELEHSLETTVTGDGRADPEGSAEYENKEGDEVDEAEKVENVSSVNTPDLQQEREAQVQKKTSGSKCQTHRRSSRKRARVDYRDNDDKQDSSESSAPEDISKSNERTPNKKKAQSRTSSPEPQSEEAEASEGVVLNLVLEEDEEQSASDEELIVIGGKVLRGRHVPSIIITPHSKSSSRRSKVHSPKGSPEQSQSQQSPEHLRKRHSAEGTPVRRSKRHRD